MNNKSSVLKCSLLLLLVVLGCNFLAQAQSVFYVPANKGYIEPFTSGRQQGVSVPVGYPENKGMVSRWTDKTKSVVWYLYHKKGVYDFSFINEVKNNVNLDFELIIKPSSGNKQFKSIDRKITFKGSGQKDSLFIAKIDVPETGYFRYELKPISAPDDAIKINSLVFSAKTPEAQVNQTDYQSSPSVHLSFKSTDNTSKSYSWIYQEILVPEGQDPVATYYMSLGFFRGYMGIQTNSATERRVLFSVWDSKDSEKDKSMTKEDFVTLVDKGENTTTNSFGGEGTGGQSYVKGANWKTGKPVKFLMNAAVQGDNSVVFSAWYKLENEDWIYIASWKAPKEKRLFDGFYSFIENFGYTNGQIRREAYYYNAWGFDDKLAKWVNFNKVRFSNTDGKEGQRIDYEQGVSSKLPDRFYMASGGYTPTVKTADEIPLSKTNLNLDLKPFAQRVEQALTRIRK